MHHDLVFEIVRDALLSSVYSNAQLQIPWCGRLLKWMVIMSPQQPFDGTLCADFIFDDDTFQPLSMPAHAPKVRELLSTQHYDAYRPPRNLLRSSAFTEVMSALMVAYQHHQLSTVMDSIKHNDRLLFELSTLPDVPGVQLMHVAGKDGEPAKACFSLPLQGLDLGGVLEFEHKTAVSTQTASNTAEGIITLTSRMPFRLTAVFKVSSAVNSEPQLQLQVPQYASSWLPSNFMLPPWTSSMCLMEFVPAVTQKLQSELDSVVKGLVLKHQVIDSLTQTLGTPLELNGTSGIALYSLFYEGCPALLHVDLSTHKFPEEAPVLTLTNVRMLGSGVEGCSIIKDCPWSPRWATKEQASRILNFVKAKLPGFLHLPQHSSHTLSTGI
ncbi:hypothetical protein CEUSTIGMA_g12549.t1 [Chlamydomonas eustigma]|uniref:BRISC and BRCA1-A complex member 2 n=1 Tax=Chlamydomonas eustigma TaxID=1157962 RepID=A0A250XQA5_9CHLO|nr:hypothetical protein CEUSTIGMA_g12549.t1 [Chlamydomonas eustigma]|eukprot:GAX85129.1 hypothetical protein CEUSTIGMA_g12549.t1 [Chlamydomonas eustigma]